MNELKVHRLQLMPFIGVVKCIHCGSIESSTKKVTLKVALLSASFCIRYIFKAQSKCRFSLRFTHVVSTL